jgi:hypothetical protein
MAVDTVKRMLLIVAFVFNFPELHFHSLFLYVLTSVVFYRSFGGKSWIFLGFN